MIHLDYIQQQSEQLAKKNKELEDLKNENEMLKQRMARMERRVSLQKMRVEKKPGEGEGSNRKRRIPPESVSGKRHCQEGLHNMGKRGGRPERISVRIKQEPDENENEPVINLDDTLTSRIAYHTLMGDKPNVLRKYVKRSNKQQPPPPQIEGPTWRVRNMTVVHSVEDTESLCDDVFQKRHLKHSVDEKRRKRWDVQRIREQRQIERLRLREGKNNRHEQVYQSLWPQYAEGLRLSVTSLVPVSVFGINLPSTTIQDFSLPWKEGTRPINSRKRTKR